MVSRRSPPTAEREPGIPTCDTAVIGAGPYGLSVAAHLRSRALDHRVFGAPLHTWRTAMLEGMLLKSDGFASNLSAPLADSTLGEYCRSREIPYHSTHLPVAVETFVEYGLDFQRRFVPDLEPRNVSLVGSRPGGYRLVLEDGEELDVRNVVVAVGITHFANVPAVFEALPAELVTHSSAHRELQRFREQDVTVVGAGASGVELAVGLAAVGARARLVARAGTVRFASRPSREPRGLLARARHPSSGLGPGLRSRLCCDAPGLFRVLPTGAREEIVRRHLGPSSPWHLQSAFSFVEAVTGQRVESAEAAGEGVRLELLDDAGARRTVETDHVVCATGYQPDLGRLSFLDAGLRGGLRKVRTSPRLSSAFESSAPGLFFTGLIGAMTFGPLMRFMHGDAFAAARITSRIARRAS